MENKFYFDRPETRAKILELFYIDPSESWQKVPTPLWVVEEMLNLVQDTPELLYVVLLNIEFLEELIYEKGIDPKRIVFMSGNKYKAALAMGMYGVKTFELPVVDREPKIAVEKFSEKISKAFYNGGVMPKTNNLVVFGNPPYQSEDGGFGKSAKSLYHLFVEAVIDHINPRYLSFIIPSRWMAGGKGLDDHREKMMEDRRIKLIRHFPDASKIFEDVDIKGGVNYFLWDREHKGKCDFNGVHRYLNGYDIIISDNDAVSTVDKILASHKGNFVNLVCFGRKPFGLKTNFDDWKNSGIVCYSIGHQKKFVSPQSFTDNNGIKDKWKVCTSNGGNVNIDSNGQISVISNLFIIEPEAICTETYIVVNSFEKEKEATLFLGYMKTKFFRFLLGLRAITQHITKEKFTWVPDLGPYNKVWTDADLYKRFKLTPKEIAYIESKIKPIG